MTNTKPTADDLARMILAAVEAARRAAYEQGRYVAGHGDPVQQRERLNEADIEANDAGVHMWRTFYDFVAHETEA